MKKRIFASALMLMMILTMCFTTAFAITIEETAWLEDNIVVANESGITGSGSWMRAWLTTDSSKAAEQTPLMTFNNNQVYLIKGKTDEGLSKQIKQSISNEKTAGGVSDITDGLNISADTGGAAAMMQGFAPIISLVLGIVVTLITVGMTIFSAFDIAYIAFPVFRNKCEDAKVQGEGVAVKKNENGEATLRFITDDAQYAVQQGSIESGKSPWVIYFGKRVMSYVMLAIILFILLTGNISLITNIALKIVSGIMNVLGGLA